MSNMQKAFKNKAKCGLRMATGGFLTDSFDTTAPPKWSVPAPVAGLGAGRAPQQRQQSPLQGLNNQIAMGNAVENSNLTMTEKAALGMGTSSAAASQLRQQTGALTTLRDSLQQPVQMAEGGIVARLAGRGAQIDAAVDAATNGGAPQVQTAEADAPDASGVRPSERAAARAQINSAKKPGLMQGLRSKLGFAQGGVVRGPGGPTEDAVPASIGTGDDKQKLKLSDGEGFMVVPAAVMAKPEAIDAINATMAAANDGKQPVGLRGAGQTTRAANGLEPAETETHWPNGQPKLAPTGESMRQPPTAQEMYFAQPVQQGMRGTVGKIGSGAATPISVVPVDGSPAPAPAEDPRMAGLRQKELARAAATAAQANRPEQARAVTPVQAAATTVLSPEQQVLQANQDRFESNQVADRLTGLAQRGMNLPADGTVVERGNTGLRAIANNDTTMKLLNASHDERGDGIKYGLRTGFDGRRQVEISGNSPSAAVNPNGPKDSFGNDMTRTNDMKRQVRELEHDRIKRTAAMPGATRGDMVAYAGQLKQDEIDGANSAKAASAQMAGLEFQRGLRKDAQAQVNTDTARGDAQAEKNAKQTAAMLDTHAPVAGLKDDELKVAQTRRAKLEQAFREANGGLEALDPLKYGAEAPKRMNQARLTVALNDALENRGMLDKLKNLGNGNRDPMKSSGTGGLKLMYKGDPANKQLSGVEYFGVPLDMKDIFGKHADVDLITAAQDRAAAHARK